MEKVLLKSRCNGRFARGRKTSEPDSASLLQSELTTLLTSEAWVPRDVAVSSQTVFTSLDGSEVSRDYATHVAIARILDGYKYTFQH